MAKGLSILFLFAVAVVGQALTPSTFLTTVDQQRLRAVFESAQPYIDVASAHYSILGLKLLGVSIPKEQEACKSITSTLETDSVASWYYASTAAKALNNCKLSPGSAEALLSAAIRDDAAVADIFYAFLALKNLGLSVDNTKVAKSLLEALKADDSPVSNGYAFLVAAELGGDVSKFFDSIEDIVAQADEVDDKYLQFEGGLFVSALVLDGAYQLAEKVKKAPTISQDKVLKFANYFMSRKHVHQLKSAYHLLSVVKTLTTNKYHIPVAVTLASPVSVSKALPNIQVRVTDLMGSDLGKLTVMAETAKNLGDQGVVLSKKPFTASKTDSSLYEIDFMVSNPACGLYRLTLNVSPQKVDSRLIGTTGAEVTVKVITQVSVENVDIGVVDKDQTTAAKTTRMQYPKKAANLVEADSHQKIVMKFQLKDKNTGQLITAHQAFVKFTNLKTKEEIIFISEPDSSLTNTFDLDVGATSKEFKYTSGRYSMDLIVGDAVIENPFSWTVADVELTLPEKATEEPKPQSQYAKKPEIKHLFREPEKRPPAIVSTAFTILVLVPLFLMFALWFKLGVNISNFPVSLSTVGFHVCLGAIFGLYYCYWHYLNMFQTLRYLGILSIPTFIFGNRLLSGIAAKRKGEK
ncbi:hypothetical protein CHS0354_025714 [Potamilus streckersoni]|uniref:Dolichyl-diphosphooligosaccharide--protein glycosyltransferase subunit 2 n=1 Tax=Potamilus streckersoni TaxID=2493646 RepID=A0AAE0S0U1_9BIVA|nr:hypothetical protein CHS0354_025714 [Potamilus streckersoni]